MDNAGFIGAIESSFVEFIRSGTSRSTRKLGPLHGAIARDMQDRLGAEYLIWSQGFRDNKEGTIAGRYMDKKVDISIFQQGRPVCGIAVKFVMQNYSQNSNNSRRNGEHQVCTMPLFPGFHHSRKTSLLREGRDFQTLGDFHGEQYPQVSRSRRRQSRILLPLAKQDADLHSEIPGPWHHCDKRRLPQILRRILCAKRRKRFHRNIKRRFIL